MKIILFATAILIFMILTTGCMATKNMDIIDRMAIEGEIHEVTITEKSIRIEMK